MVGHNKQTGFTLIELMLAVSLLMLVMFSGYYAYGLYTTKWQKRVDIFWQNSQQAMAFDSMSKLLESAQPYVIIDKEEKPSLYFSGDNSRIRFVTNTPLLSEASALVELAIEQRDGSYLLVYREYSIAFTLFLTQPEPINWDKQVVLLNELTQARFSYFGWQSFSEVLKVGLADETELDPASNISQQWYNEHRLEFSRIMPSKVNIELMDKNEQHTNITIALPIEGHKHLFSYLRVEG